MKISHLILTGAVVAIAFWFCSCIFFLVEAKRNALQREPYSEPQVYFEKDIWCSSEGITSEPHYQGIPVERYSDAAGTSELINAKNLGLSNTALATTATASGIETNNSNQVKPKRANSATTTTSKKPAITVALRDQTKPADYPYVLIQGMQKSTTYIWPHVLLNRNQAYAVGVAQLNKLREQGYNSFAVSTDIANDARSGFIVIFYRK